MNSANTKKTKGLRATGVAAVTCARHETFRPNGMGDLQVGERYVLALLSIFCQTSQSIVRYSNMDFIALFNLVGCAINTIYLSYDIACQWAKNFSNRMSTFPDFMHIPSWVELIFKVPKFHLPIHILKCHAPFSFGYTEGAAKTDGEGPERCWAWLNNVARSISMMTAGARWDTMDDFANFWNWRKNISLGA